MENGENIVERIALSVEAGKVDAVAAYPPDLRGQAGADELTKEALASGVPPGDILENGFVAAMERVGRSFAEGRIFVPQMLMSAKAMSVAMRNLEPYFQSGEVRKKGTFVIGTVAGDLHEIGKNLAAMMIKGAGWDVIDLGKDVPAGRFIESVGSRPESVVGLSALLTTTMPSMEATVRELRETFGGIKIIVGGAPLTDGFAKSIGADLYAPDPQVAVRFLAELG